MYNAKDIILSQITPALGCTEPAAIALNAAYFKDYCKNLENITLIINTNLLKNAMYVPIPNTGRKFGVKLAFALGLICGKKEKKLNIFEDVNKECIEKAKEILPHIKLEIIEGNEIYIKSKNDKCEVLTQKFHDNVTYVKTENQTITFSNKKQKINTSEIEEWFKKQPFETVYDYWDEDFSYLKETIDLNLKLSLYGQNNDCALNINKQFITDSLEDKIKKFTTAASDARMEGVNLPAMSLCGSGNHGIAATLPVFIYAKEKGYDENEIYKAVGLSMLITTYIKLHTGRLSPICGAAFASGCGVAGSIAFLESKDKNIANNAVKLIIENILGVICDGAKMACSIKVLLGVQNAINAAKFALSGIKTYNDGILDKDMTKTIINVGKTVQSMMNVDNTITEIMKEKALK
jgi:L-cysteine desulfidase